MTVRELIEILKTYDQNLTVIYSTQEDNYEPSPAITKFDFNSHYWDDNMKIAVIPKDTEFVTL